MKINRLRCKLGTETRRYRIKDCQKLGFHFPSKKRKQNKLMDFRNLYVAAAKNFNFIANILFYCFFFVIMILRLRKMACFLFLSKPFFTV